MLKSFLVVILIAAFIFSSAQSWAAKRARVPSDVEQCIADILFNGSEHDGWEVHESRKPYIDYTEGWQSDTGTLWVTLDQPNRLKLKAPSAARAANWIMPDSGVGVGEIAFFSSHMVLAANTRQGGKIFVLNRRLKPIAQIPLNGDAHASHWAGNRLTVLVAKANGHRHLSIITTNDNVGGNPSVRTIKLGKGRFFLMTSQRSMDVEDEVLVGVVETGEETVEFINTQTGESCGTLKYLATRPRRR